MSSVPALQIPQGQDLLQKFGQLQQLQNMRQQSQMQQQEAPARMQILGQQAQLGAAQVQEQQRAQKDQAAFRELTADPANKDKTVGELADLLAQKGQISQAGLVGAKKADLETRSALAKLDGTVLANQDAAHKQTQQLYNNVMNLPDDQLAANWPQIAQQYDAIPGNNKQPLDPNKPLTKQELSHFGPVIAMGNAYFDQELARRQKQTDLQQSQGKTDPTSPLYAPSSASVAMGTAPGADQIQAGEVKQSARKAGAAAAARQPYELALAAQRQALSQGDPKAAAQLMIDGDATLSELKARGATPSFIARTLFNAKQLSGGKYNAQAADAQFQVAKSPTNVAFFGSANSLIDKGGTLDQLEEAAKDIPGGQIPVFNSIADAAKAATGSGPIAKYASILLGVADDYSKVMGGGQGSDTSRSQALKLAPTNASPEARHGGIEGIRGAVLSQATSRIGKNPILGRMYSAELSQAGGAQPAQGSGSGQGVKLSEAMALPQNHGKSQQQVIQDIQAHGHTVIQ